MAECQGSTQQQERATAELVGTVRKSGRVVCDSAGVRLCSIEIKAANQIMQVVGEGPMAEPVSALTVGQKVTIRGDLRIHLWSTAGGQERAAVQILLREIEKHA